MPPRPTKGRIHKPVEPSTAVRVRVTALEKSQLDDFCQEHGLKISDLMRLGMRFVMKHPELL